MPTHYIFGSGIDPPHSLVVVVAQFVPVPVVVNSSSRETSCSRSRTPSPSSREATHVHAQISQSTSPTLNLNFTHRSWISFSAYLRYSLGYSHRPSHTHTSRISNLILRPPSYSTLLVLPLGGWGHGANLRKSRRITTLLPLVLLPPPARSHLGGGGCVHKFIRYI